MTNNNSDPIRSSPWAPLPTEENTENPANSSNWASPERGLSPTSEYPNASQAVSTPPPAPPGGLTGTQMATGQFPAVADPNRTQAPPPPPHFSPGAPAVEAPVQAPAYQAPAYQAPAYQAPTYQAPAPVPPWQPQQWTPPAAPPMPPWSIPPAQPVRQGPPIVPPLPPGYTPTPGSMSPGQRPVVVPGGGDSGGKLLAAIIGAVVGALIAALVSSGIWVARDSNEPDIESPVSAVSTRDLDIHRILEIAQPSVVLINTSSGGQTLGAGSGFVYDGPERLILTNAHVIEGADEVTVTMFDGTASRATVVGSLPDEDLAMLKLTDQIGLTAAKLGSSAGLEVGDSVVAIGNALGLGGKPTVTTGIVSAKDRTIPGPDFVLNGLIQTDAAINPGNSGGPLVNARGEVVGINTAKIPDASNVGFALAIDNLLPLIKDLEAGKAQEQSNRAYLGVVAISLSDPSIPPGLLEEYGIDSRSGAIVSVVSPGSSAALAGIEPGDVIVALNSSAIETSDALTSAIRESKVGDRVILTIERRGEKRDVTVTLKSK